ncbi:MAG: HAD family hydrolase [Candidatus Zixiibacteriota bacterium]
MKYPNIIFDLDGTLIDSSDGVVEAVNYSLRMMGESEQPAEKIKPFIGYPLSRMYQSFTDVPVKQLYRHFQTKASETVVSSTTMLAGVAEILERLSQDGYQLGIASTKIRVHIDGIVSAFDWSDRFVAVAGGDEVDQVKPAPHIMLLMIGRMNATADNTLVVGDTENDVLAAHAAGLPAIGVRSPYGCEDRMRAAQPDWFIDSISTLTTLLRDIEKHNDKSTQG